MVIQTPRLCNDIAFQPPQVEAANSIICSPIFSPEQAEAHEQQLATLPEASEVTDPEIWAANPDAAVAFGVPVPSPVQVAGDIVVGGRNIVPQGVKLEKSAIVGGGKEKFIETIADSEGHMLNQETLEKLGLGNPKDVEAFKKKLEDIAQGGKWKLDVVETPRGREYRGVIDDGKDEEGEGVAEEAEKDQVKQMLPQRESRTREEESEEKQEGEGGSEEEFYLEEL